MTSWPFLPGSWFSPPPSFGRSTTISFTKTWECPQACYSLQRRSQVIPRPISEPAFPSSFSSIRAFGSSSSPSWCSFDDLAVKCVSKRFIGGSSLDLQRQHGSFPLELWTILAYVARLNLLSVSGSYKGHPGSTADIVKPIVFLAIILNFKEAR